MYATLKRRADGVAVMSLEELRAEFDLVMRKRPLCPYCLARLSHKNVSLDHRIPARRGGTHTTPNIDFVCVGCNKSKGDMTDIEYCALLDALDALEVRTRNFKLKSKVLTALRISSSFRFGADRRARKS